MVLGILSRKVGKDRDRMEAKRCFLELKVE